MANTGKAGGSGKSDKAKEPSKRDPAQGDKFVWKPGDVTVYPPPKKGGSKGGKK